MLAARILSRPLEDSCHCGNGQGDALGSICRTFTGMTPATVGPRDGEQAPELAQLKELGALLATGGTLERREGAPRAASGVETHQTGFRSASTPSDAAFVYNPAQPSWEVNVIHEAGLSQTLDAVNEQAFNGRKASPAERKRVARWIAARQGLPGAYGDTFAGLPAERKKGIVVFTGERITSASARHILGEESCRVLRWLSVRERNVQAALERANAGLMSCLTRAARDPRNTNPGKYCCGKCSVGLWRNLASGGLDRQEERLRRGVGELLREHRAGEGKWRVFPFWYTVLALVEIDLPEAREELGYAAPVLERAAARAIPSSVHGKRRHELARRALGAM